MRRQRAAVFRADGRIQKRCRSASKMKQSVTGPFFCRFSSTSKAVLRCIKNEAE